MKMKLKKIVGIDYDENAVAAGEFIRKGKKMVITRLASHASLKELASDSRYRNADVLVNAPSNMVLFRSFPLSGAFLKSKNKKKEIAAFLARQNLPFKLDDCYWDTFLMNSNLHFFAAKKESIDKYVAAIVESGLKCLGVIPSLIAMSNVFIYNYPDRRRTEGLAG